MKLAGLVRNSYGWLFLHFICTSIFWKINISIYFFCARCQIIFSTLFSQFFDCMFHIALATPPPLFRIGYLVNQISFSLNIKSHLLGLSIISHGMFAPILYVYGYFTIFFTFIILVIFLQLLFCYNYYTLFIVVAFALQLY